MIETSAAFTPPQNNTAYQEWRASMAASRVKHAGTQRYDVNDRTAGPVPVFGELLDRETMLSAGMANALTTQTTHGMHAAQPEIVYDKTTEGGFDFGDVVDMLNPLQHLPVVGMLYRKFTGDTMKPMAQIVGGAVFGGPIGAIGGTINAIVQTQTGKDIGDNMMAMVSGGESFKAKPPALVYKESVPAASLASSDTKNENMVVANLYAARDGRHNFASLKAYEPQRWNA